MNNNDLLHAYSNLNNSFKKVLIFRIGSESGFFSEYNNMILAMLYCLDNKIKFKLYSHKSNFSSLKGWEDFFLPFCEEVSDSFHEKWNYRYPLPSFRDYYKYKQISYFKFAKWLLKYNIWEYTGLQFIKQFYGFNYCTYHLFDRFRDKSLLKKKYNIPELGIVNVGIQEACSVLINMTWKYNNETEKEIELYQKANRFSEAMFKKNVSLHIRGGDKITETALYTPDKYMKMLEKSTSEKNVFVLTDDYRVIDYLNINYTDYNIYTFCKQDEKGYYHNSFVNKKSSEKREALIKLFASMDIINKSVLFIGTYSSNPGMYIGMRNPKIMKGMDFENWRIM